MFFPIAQSIAWNPEAALEVTFLRRYGRPPARRIQICRGWQFSKKLNNKRGSSRVRSIYKICPASAWREAERHGTYRGSADDLRDGFIHFSTAAQVAGTAAKYFHGQTGLFLIAVDADALGDALRWEPSRGGDLFPHLYGDLDLGAVTAILDLRACSDGSHDIPELTP